MVIGRTLECSRERRFFIRTLKQENTMSENIQSRKEKTLKEKELRDSSLQIITTRWI